MNVKNYAKRALSLVLVLCMLIGVVPMGIISAAAAETSEPIYVLAGGDFQAGDNGKEDHYYSRINMGNILDKVKETYSTMNGFLFVGDYDGDTHNDSNATTGIAAMMEEVTERFPTLNHDNSILMQGNHESANVSGIDPTGGYEFDGYAVYSMNQSDYCEKQEGKSAQIQGVADDLEAWLNNKLGEGYDAPIFVTAHVPLAYGTRTYTNGDGLYAKYIFDVLNTAADNGLNIIFLHGHDHAYGADNYLGGEAIYLPKGDKINIAEPGDKTSWTEETLNFTYMNAGYVGYYNENYYNVTSYEAEKLTMTVFKIENNQVTVQRISKDGLYNLKSAGREGFYANGGTCAGIGLSYNTTVYASPQTITLMSNANEAVGTINNWVGVEGTMTDDVTTSGDSWVTLTEASSGETIFKLTNTLTAGKKYVIVNSNTAGNANATNLNNNNYYNYSINSVGVEVFSDSNGTYIKAPAASAQWTYNSSEKFQNVSSTSSYLRGRSGTGSLRVGNSNSTYTSWTYDATYGLSVENYTNYALNSSFSLANRSSTNRVYIYEEYTLPGSNGLYAYLKGDLRHTIADGMDATAALQMVKDGIDIQYATAANYSDEQNYPDDGEGITWTLDPKYDPNVPGDYAVTIAYNGKTIGVAEVIVPPTTTYCIAEGNGMYYVNMNATADEAMNTVKTGVTVSSATSESGANKQTIDDSLVTWKWVDTYNGADSGPYTVEILYNGTSLGTVEVKVNVKYTTEINPDWSYVGETEGTGGTHTYTLDTDGIDYGEEHKYIIVDDNEAIVLNANSASNGTAHSITISGNTATLNTRDYEYHMIKTSYNGNRYELITKGNGSQYLYQESNGVRYGTRSSVKFQVNHHGNGIYDIHDIDGTNWYIVYSGGWTVTETTSARVRLYKYTGTTGGTPAGSVYAKLEGDTIYTVDQGTSAYEALAAVKAGITAYTSTDANGTGKTEIADSELTFKWKNTYVSMVTGSYWVEISYKGVVLGTVEVQVKPGVINNYPEYPDEGAVKVNKTATGIDFQSSGIARVEISASGVPMKKGVDVVVVVDTSSSMTNPDNNIGTQTRLKVLQAAMENMIDSFNQKDEETNLAPDIDVAIVDFNGYGSEYAHLIDGTWDFADNGKVYTGDKTKGSAGAFVSAVDLLTFNVENEINKTYSGTNYDGGLKDAYRLLEAKAEANKAAGDVRDQYVIFLSDGAPFGWNGIVQSDDASATGYYWWNELLQGNYKSLAEMAAAAQNHATFPTSVINTEFEFLYSGNGTIHPNRWAEAIKGTGLHTVLDTVAGTTAQESDLTQVEGLGATIYSIGFGLKEDSRTSNNKVGRVTVETMTELLETIASEDEFGNDYYWACTDANQLNAAFNQITGKIRAAAYNARFVDQMGDNYNLQMKTANYVFVDGDTTTNKSLTPVIEIISYDIYTKAEADEIAEGTAGDTVTEAMIGTRKGTYTVLEVIRFNSAGTKAYSNKIDADGDGIFGWTENTANGNTTYTFDEDDNILADGTKTGFVEGVIYAKTFIYNTNIKAVAVEGVNIPTGVNADGTTTGSTSQLPSETFYWKMGTVQSSELAMRYFVYLEGSMEGEKEAGSYATNEFATLYYDNYLGNHCYKDTVSPTVAWKEANVSYAFYLVDANGNVVVNQTTGATGSFANKVAVTSPVVFETILLNNLDQVRSIDVASATDNILPEGYALYDSSSVYTITINSNTTGSWEIVKSANKIASTYVTHYDIENPSAYSNALVDGIDGNGNYIVTGHDYTHTTVWFAVLWEPQTIPDAIVVDYGLPVDISVLANDMFGENGELVGVATNGSKPVTALNANTDNLDANFKTTENTTFATVSVNGSEVRYTINTSNGMQFNTVDYFDYAVYYANTTDAGYYYGDVTVIPASIIYYEENFITFTDSTATSGDFGKWKTDGTVDINATQDEDRPGEYSIPSIDANNVYGYDGAYKNCTTYSNGGSKKVTVNEATGGMKTAPIANFTFTGTGFDIISLTDNTSGCILVTVKDTNGTVVRVETVDNYYGYTYNNETGEWAVDTNSIDKIWQVPVIKIDSLNYGTYTAEIKVVYIDAFDYTGDNSYTFVLDAIRIYDPAPTSATINSGNYPTIGSIYAADKEADPAYKTLRDILVDANSLGTDDDTTDVIEGAVFIDGNNVNTDISLYAGPGPNNETYLAMGQGITFKLLATSKPESLKVGIKLAYGEDAIVILNNVRSRVFETSTDMYYTVPLNWKQNSDGIYVADVVLSNSTDSVVSITNIKLVGAVFAETQKNKSTVVNTLEEEETLAAVSIVSDKQLIETVSIDMVKIYSADKLNETGDINGDGAVNGKDSNLMTRIVSGNVVPTLIEKIAADVKEDNTVNGVDANGLKRMVAGN